MESAPTVANPMAEVSRIEESFKIPRGPYSEGDDEFEFSKFPHKTFGHISVRLESGWGYTIEPIELPDYWRISIVILEPGSDWMYDDIGGTTPYSEAEDLALEYIQKRVSVSRT
jgi:hypothetical protein